MGSEGVKMLKKRVRYMNVKTGAMIQTQREAVAAWLAGATIKAFLPGDNGPAIMWEH
jgi:hypothetical protein